MQWFKDTANRGRPSYPANSQTYPSPLPTRNGPFRNLLKRQNIKTKLHADNDVTQAEVTLATAAEKKFVYATKLHRYFGWFRTLGGWLPTLRLKQRLRALIRLPTWLYSVVDAAVTAQCWHSSIKQCCSRTEKLNLLMKPKFYPHLSLY